MYIMVQKGGYRADRSSNFNKGTMTAEINHADYYKDRSEERYDIATGLASYLNRDDLITGYFKQQGIFKHNNGSGESGVEKNIFQIISHYMPTP